MRLYETGFLVAPGMTEDEAETIVRQMADVVAQKNGRMIRIERWGKRRMAYAIGKAQEAYYIFFHYEGGSEIPLELGRRFRQMDTILRYLTLVKETTRNVRKKKKAKGAPAAEAEEAAGGEAKSREEV
ncbi:MAG: 30S ribosomal protein S6 [Candidatus Aminicenantes bacterium]|nr:30S ribosomal protein S6 [Candidatus Aminicenantes bacterium]